MNKIAKRRFFIGLPISFIIGLLVFFLVLSVSVITGKYYLLIISFIPLLFYYSLFEYEKIYYFIVIATPLSIGLQWMVPEAPFNLSVPSEALMGLMLLLLFSKLLKSNVFRHEIFTHPISITIIISLVWMFITSITSSMPLVSFKYLIARMWFVFPLYFFPVFLFRKNKNIYRFFFLYMIAFTVVIIYSINKHLAFGLFNKNAAHFVMQPFYNDHTSYGAIVAMYIPVIAGLLTMKKTGLTKLILWALLVLFSIALVLSFTRGAWISVLGAVVLGLILYMKLKIRYVFAIAGIAIVLLFSYRLEIIDKLSKNKQDSSAELSEHVKSISNIATDASNLERINRWNSAIKMIKERPFFGWGPGTYMFQYAPFQMACDKTIISTNFAEGGNAHSEYIGPTAELGFVGLLTFLAILISIYYRGFKLYYSTENKSVKKLVLISLLSLTTYFIHGLLNNYLDTDKASVPFWGMIAIIASLDLYSGKNKNPQLGGAEER